MAWGGVRPAVSHDPMHPLIPSPSALNAGPIQAPTSPLPGRRASPFIRHNYFGGGFVSDDDRVALTSLFACGSDGPGGTGGRVLSRRTAEAELMHC